MVNNVVTEDYVSFETAKLLKEKGFDWETFASIVVFRGHRYEVNGELIAPEEDTIIPTLQMAMKWLRDVYNVGVFPSIYGITDRGGTIESYSYGTDIVNLQTHELMYGDILPKDTYEQACEAAIRYCLENLI